jgi:hypothetical protein
MTEVFTVLVFFLLSLVPATLVLSVVIYALRAGRKLVGRCGGCGYDLRGLGSRRECPECGRHFELDAKGNAVS